MTATQRVRRVSFNDLINSIRYINDDSPESPQGMPDNDQGSIKCFNDCLDAKTRCGSGANAILEGKKSKMPSSKINVHSHEDSRDLSNQDNTPTKVVHVKEIVQGDYLSSGMPKADSQGSKFGEVLNLIVAIFFIFFLLQFYFRLVFASKAEGKCYCFRPFKVNPFQTTSSMGKF